ncbi:MAG: SPFH/Band 7/PHB domain protein [Bacteroidaceae bacterium]|jgi:regulator of protease activity HflC (stomatin/prohibitin superfamily)|uniref:SPFH domain-containing protein n=1 Tax=unclassified Bacteroides TaxID=2646097 RepID=UPI0004E178F0|nr:MULTISPECIES: SPFH domain-containing protein [unclassified Bacteroides]MBO4596314.1 SPFH/Band 7/PHB domain protein [Bacteroidaceae bacterium]SDG03667.1 Regulator of protease activity HflC, stomatin/prohibitin superfamily [Bacteroidales bacterium KHT7]MBP3244614.1 SPFH/Band 7/PHB domain protein [Bacteroidaceae bacterium]MBQ2055019.1 SPFH/Band 7/PHB domain protein [Bacteroidaceae bacterium]MBQ3770744.1 SPFH/Band 7/PHB domain protein [Bacteroidaceae bacterium]
MDPLLIFLGVLVVLVIIVVQKSIKIIPQSETKIVERLGRYHATLNPGINIIIPFIDKPKELVVLKHNSYRYTDVIDLREQVYDFDKQNVITKDNVQTQINALLYFQIVDPFKAVYEIDNLPNAIEKLTQTTLRNIIGELELDETLTSRDTINTKLRAVLDDATDKWGIKVNRVELQDITPPASVLNAMEKQMQAERNKRAEILNSEGEKQSAILRSEGEKASMINNAEADKQAAILRAEANKQKAVLEAEGEAQATIRKAEAEAEAINKIKQAIGDSNNPINYLVALKYMETLNQIAGKEGNKTVYLPYEATGMMGSIGGIKDLFKDK